MNTWIDKIRNRHNEIFIGFMLVCFMALMLFLLPREVKFKYEFEQGGIWKHEDMYAPFDYAIAKSEAEIEEESIQIRLNNLPVYSWDEEIAPIVQQDFINSFTASWEARNKSLVSSIFENSEKDSLRLVRHLGIGQRLLREVLKRGYVRWDERHSADKSFEEFILLRDKKARTQSVGAYLTYPSMHKWVAEELKREDKIDSDFLLEEVESALRYNIRFDEERTNMELEEQLAAIVLYKGKVAEGARVISRGEHIDQDRYQMLSSLRTEFESQSVSSDKVGFILLGQILLIGVCLLAFIILLRVARRGMLAFPSRILSILLLISLLAIAIKLTGQTNIVHPYLVPVCVIILTIRAFYDEVLAVLIHVLAIFILSFLVPNQFEFVFLHFFAGVLLLYGLKGLNKRSHFFNSTILIFLSYSFTYFGINIIHEGDVRKVAWEMYGWFAGNAALSLLAFPLIYVYERVFGLLSEIRLLEIADSNNTLLRALNEKAPGTFQHSLQVSNLAEEAIRKIGGNVLLVRAGALYHDIGKMYAPEYFIENLNQSQNPHDELPNRESAKIIIDHVIKGIEMARKNNLPEDIIDFIRTHHGTTTTEYFYRMEVRELGEEAVKRSDFQYPGPLPFSKETAVLMMADSVEAASRSIKEVDAQKIENLVDGIIDYQMSAGQFANADVTMKDISAVKTILKRKLMNIYHVRIEYPSK